jgi:hypothetical protein
LGVEKNEKLYEALLKSEREKIALLQERKNAMANADSLRVFLMATALSMYSDKEYMAFLSDFK